MNRREALALMGGEALGLHHRTAALLDTLHHLQLSGKPHRGA